MAELKMGGGAGPLSIDLVRHMIVNSIRANKVKFAEEYGQLVICTDGRDSWRKKVFPHYKFRRKAAKDNGPFNWAEIMTILNQVRDELYGYFPYTLIHETGAEGDDVIATLVERHSTLPVDASSGLFEEKEHEPVLIISGDHDFVQLQRYPFVKQWNPIKKKWVEAEDGPDAVLKEHIICGDDGDGVPNMLSADDSFSNPTGRQRPMRKANVAIWKHQPVATFANTPELMRNYQRNELLVDLRKTPQEIKDRIIKSFEFQQGKRNRSKLLNFFAKHNMVGMMGSLSDF
jgi:hypothetical protein